MQRIQAGIQVEFRTNKIIRKQTHEYCFQKRRKLKIIYNVYMCVYVCVMIKMYVSDFLTFAFHPLMYDTIQ